MHRRAFLQRSAAASLGLAMTKRRASAQAAEKFAAHQAKRREDLWALLGELPRRKKPAGKLLKTEKRDGFTLEHLELDLNGLEAVPAYLLLPDRRPKKAPALLYIHWHGGDYDVGKEELFRGTRGLKPMAPVVAEKGIVALAIDSWCFGQRQKDKDGRAGELDAFKLMLWQGRVLFGMMLFDEWQALNYLCGRPEVDAERLGVFGMSMGATKAWWLAALDPRVKLCVDLCCLTDFEELIKIKNLKGHGIYYYVPRLLQHFQTSDINELIVPRPRLSLNGKKDLLTPPAGVEKVRDHVYPLYAKYGKKEDCRIELFDCGHEELPEMRKLILEWLDRYLVRGP